MKTRALPSSWPDWFLVALMLYALAAEPARANAQAKATPFEALIVEVKTVDPIKVSAWKKEGFRAVILMIDEQQEPAALTQAAQAIASESLDLYYWIEVGRNPALARERPRWMAALGMHNDWRLRFPKVRALAEGEVAKAWPWVPIGYQESFEFHLKRIGQILKRAPAGYKGVLLNDIQGGPASCGCGNVQCRWAVDYEVPSTATKITEPNIAGRFVTEVSRSFPGKEIIPVWAPECDEEDLPADKRPKGAWGTGYCAGVPCFDFCRKRFAEQWAPLCTARTGPIGVLLLQREFERERKEYGETGGWITHAVEYLEKRNPKPIPRQRLWLVVQGYDVKPEQEAEIRRLAGGMGAGAVAVARGRIDQSYEPRIVKVKPDP